MFEVDVYPTIAEADASIGLVLVLASDDYGIRGEVLSQQKRNVRVVYESGRPLVRKRFRAALEQLP